MLKKIIAIAVLAIFFVSCKKNLPDIGNTAAVKVANEWWVTLDSVGISDYYGIGHLKIATYNTAADDNTIWVDDFGNIWPFKIKATVDYASLTFSNPAAIDENNGIKVNLMEGKVLSKAGHSKSGNIVDSIYMKLEFEDDPGFIYEITGHERTRFVEDEY